MTDENTRIAGITPPKTAGYWVLPGSVSYGEVRYCMPRRPVWLHRVMMRTLLGWVWRDSETKGDK